MNKKNAENWLVSADGDIRNIEYILNDEYLTHIIAFHARQIVEKSLKACIEYLGDTVPRIHNLIKLYDKAKHFLALEIDLLILKSLDELYIDSRYPGEFGILPEGKPTLEEARDFFEFAKNIYKVIKLKLELE